MSEIIKGKLYLGDLFDANNEKLLELYKVTGIFCVASNLPINLSIQTNYKLYTYDIFDVETFNISQYFNEITNIIEDEPVAFVHCAAGVSRSPTIVLAYLMKFYNMTLKDALYLVKQKRPIICPNRSFVKQLIEYENKLYKENSITYEEFIRIVMMQKQL
jgi:hypothetical protein